MKTNLLAARDRAPHITMVMSVVRRSIHLWAVAVVSAFAPSYAQTSCTL